MKQGWLRQLDWQTAVSLNADICAAHTAMHGPTTDGYAQTEEYWNVNHQRELTLPEAIEICGKCHRLAPFCNYNGATFMAIIRDCISHFTGLSVQQAAVMRSLAGHMVAGTATPEEIAQFKQLLLDIEHGVSTSSKTLQSGSYHVGDGVQTLKGTLTGAIVEITNDGSIKWKCDQTGTEMTGTPNSLKAYPSD